MAYPVTGMAYVRMAYIVMADDLFCYVGHIKRGLRAIDDHGSSLSRAYPRQQLVIQAVGMDTPRTTTETLAPNVLVSVSTVRILLAR